MKLRLDRLVTLSCVQPCLKFLAVKDQSVPILMYHSITDEDESAVRAYYRTTTSPSVFALQLQHLRDQGYASWSLADAVNHLQTEGVPGGRFVVITFDDGYTDFRRHAFPILQEYGFTATVFLPTAYIGDSPISFKGRECLTWAEVREMDQNGISFGSHTVTHPQLRELKPSAIRDEVGDSKETIENKLGHEVDSFAYPYAFPQTDSDFKSTLGEFLKEAGYRTGVCTVVGRANRASDPLLSRALAYQLLGRRCLIPSQVDGCVRLDLDHPAHFQNGKGDGARLANSTQA